MNFARHIRWIPALLILGFVLNSCQSGSGEVKAPELGLEEIRPDTSLKTRPQTFEEVYAERIASGDTVPDRHPKLEQMLPEEVEGYKLEIRDGSSFITKEFAFSEAIRVFYRDEEGKDYLEFQLADYVADSAFLANLIGRYNSADGIEFEGNVDSRLETGTDRALAWTHFRKKSGLVRLEAAIDFRYHLKIEANQQKDPEFVSQLWQKIRLPD